MIIVENLTTYSKDFYPDYIAIGIGRGPNGRNMNTCPILKKGWLGNPYSMKYYSRERCIERFKEDFYKRLKADSEFKDRVDDIAEIPKVVLLCFCKPDACHGDVIKEYLERVRHDREETTSPPC